MSRFKAFLIHLGISACIGAVVLLTILWLWYPPPLFDADGGSTLTLLLIGVDLALGPLLTLIVFRSGKPSLRFDVSVIALLQASALAYGVWISAQSRPAYVVLLPNRARIVHANEIFEPPAEGQFAKTPWLGPAVVVATPPDDAGARNDLLWAVVSGAPDIDYRPRHYRSIADVTDLTTYGRPYTAAVASSPDQDDVMQGWRMRNSPPLPEAARVLPLLTRGRELSLIIDPVRHQVIGFVDPPLPDQ